MLSVFLLAKEEARYRQPTDVQKPTASYAAVLTGRCTGAETVICRCSDTGSSFFCRSKNYQDYIHTYSTCVQRIRTAYTTVPTLVVLSSVDQTTRLGAYVQRKIKDKINQKQKKFKNQALLFLCNLFSSVCVLPF
jgi:hypothetical protein